MKKQKEEITYITDLGKYEDVNWYIKDDGVIKVNFEKSPDWWKKELDGLKINE